MKRLLRSLAALAVAGAAGGVLSVAWQGRAGAATVPPWEPDSNSVGGLVLYNSAGQQITGGNLSDSPFAAYAQGTSAIRAGDTKASLFGYLPVLGQSPGQWSGEQIGSSTVFPNPSAPGALATSVLPLQTGAGGDETIGQLEADFPNNDTSSDGYAGMYVLRLKTSGTGLPATSRYDSADIQITGSTWKVVYPVPTLTSTTTSLGTSPAEPQVAGTSVTLTATVSPAAPGTVQFESGTSDIGSPVSVASDGTASLSTTSLPVGSDSLSAVFTPAPFSAYSGSTGDASYEVTAPPAAGTTTALAVDPSTAPADTAVTISAAVTETSDASPLAAGDGEVKFYDDGTDTSGAITSNSVLLGTVSVGSGGVASVSYSSFAEGDHNLVADFVPTDSATYDASVSLPVDFAASAPPIAPAPQTVDVSIPAGSLTITTPYSAGNPFQLGTAVLDPSAAELTASAPFGSATNPGQGVTITDTRAGDQPWTASVTVTDFNDGSGDVINGENLTLTGVTASYIAGNALQNGDVTTTDVTNSGVYDPTDPGSAGLKGGPHVFASAANGDGSVYIDGLLTLVAPTSTPAGTYTATLTFTIV